jgi:hypothetical protein
MYLYIPKKPYTPTGFEPMSFRIEAVAMAIGKATPRAKQKLFFKNKSFVF